MKITNFTILAGLLSSPVIAHDLALNPGTYTNEEEVYFDDLAKRPVAPWISISVRQEEDGLTVERIDAFGKTAKQSLDRSKLYQKSPDRIDLTLPDGKKTELRKAQGISCWVAIRKDKPMADGSEDWYFTSGVKLHDQGGRALVGGGDSGTQQVMIRLRNVTWDTGSTNSPVMALYIHKPDKWASAESYSWAAPDSERVGINLRWVQTGCSVENAKTQSKLTDDKFKKQEEDKK